MRRHAVWMMVGATCALAAGSLWSLDPVAMPSPSSSATRLFAVYSGRTPRTNHYVPSGYMGDNDLHVSGAFLPAREGSGTILRVTYEPRGPKGWSGLYWQQPANNWGERPGQSGYDLRGAKRLVFWARGEKGGETIREIKIGGIVGHYPDSDVVSMGPIKLTSDWKQYTVDLKGKDLRHIIGGFSFAMNKYDNAGRATFYLDDIGYELPPLAAELPAVTNTVTETTPALTGAAPGVCLPEPSDIKVTSETQGLRVSIRSQLLFEFNKSEIRADSAALLKQIIDLINTYPNNNVRIEGHTDNVGSSAYNMTLSRHRAETVQKYLVGLGGFDSKRLSTVGYGFTRPIASNATTSGRAQNRRVEVVILKEEDKK